MASQCPHLYPEAEKWPLFWRPLDSCLRRKDGMPQKRLLFALRQRGVTGPAVSWFPHRVRDDRRGPGIQSRATPCPTFTPRQRSGPFSGGPWIPAFAGRTECLRSASSLPRGREVSLVLLCPGSRIECGMTEGDPGSSHGLRRVPPLPRGREVAPFLAAPGFLPSQEGRNASEAPPLCPEAERCHWSCCVLDPASSAG
jgi:hypothetical protein